MELKKNKYLIGARWKPLRSDEQIDGFYGSATLKLKFDSVFTNREHQRR